MESIIITIVGFFLIFIIYQKKVKRIDSSTVVLLLYLLVSIFGIDYYKNHPNYSLSINGSLYLILICAILFYPILVDNSVYRQQVKLKFNIYLKITIAIYAITCILVCHDYYQLLYKLLYLGDWSELKTLAYLSGVDSHGGFLYVLSRYYVGAFRHLIVIIGFLILCSGDKNPIFGYILMALGLLPELLYCLLIVYRGGLLVLGLDIICIFLIVKRWITKSNLKVLYVVIVLLITSGAVLGFIMTLSRFDDSASESLLSYFGQSMVEYNYGIASRIENNAGGKYFFSYFLGLSKDEIWKDSLFSIKTFEGQALDTMVGVFLVDFGFIGCFLFALIVAYIFSNIFKSNSPLLAKLYLFVFYTDFLILGAFHASPGIALNWIIALLTFCYIKYFVR